VQPRAAGDPVESAYRLHSRAVLASVVRLLGGFDLAEEGLHEAFLAATAQWPRDGVPRDPRSWLISAGRFRVIDRLRSKARLDAVRGDLSRHLDRVSEPMDPPMEDDFPDDRLRLIFICCHPSLPVGAQVAMALREVCGLTTEQIAAAFLASAPTIAQRIVRAKARIRDLALPYVVPGADELEQRMEGVLRVIYLIFTEGYANPERGGSSEALCNEAIRLAPLLRDLQSDSEVIGLLALMLLQDSRRAAGSTPTATCVCWMTRIARSGTGRESSRAAHSLSKRCPALRSAPLLSRRRSPPAMRALLRSRASIGIGFSHSTTF
jgi:RNA polymerase sigma-70 factor, ECF subfamily